MSLEHTGIYTHTNAYFLTDNSNYLGKINASKLEMDLDIERMAQEDAELALSLKQTPDDLPGEQEILNSLEDLKKVIDDTYSYRADENLERAREILKKADPENFENELKTIFANESKKCKEELTGVKREYLNACENENAVQDELKTFREKNGLTERTADIVPADKYYARIGLIFLILIIETILNGNLFGGALLDSIVLASVPSMLNCFFGIFTAASYRCTFAKHLRKRGYFGILLGTTLIFSLNLSLAHYRTAMTNIETVHTKIDKLNRKETLSEKDLLEIAKLTERTNADAVALKKIMESPFEFDGIQSVFLFFLGVICSFLNGMEYFHLDDPYPEYGKRWKKMEAARAVPIALAEKFSSVKEDFHQRTIEQMKKAYDSLMADTRSPFDGLIKIMKRYQEDLPGAERELETTGKRILSLYYKKYAETASDYIPEKKTFKIERKPVKNIVEELKLYQQKLEQELDREKITSVYAEEVKNMNSEYDLIKMDEPERENM